MAENEISALQEIDAEEAAFMAHNHFRVYMDNDRNPFTLSTIENPLFSWDKINSEQHTFLAPMTEVAQSRALDALTEKIDDLEHKVDNMDNVNVGSIAEYAEEMREVGEMAFKFRQTQNIWVNVCESIAAGETKYIHNWLGDLERGGVEVDDIRTDLKEYEHHYLKPEKERLEK